MFYQKVFRFLSSLWLGMGVLAILGIFLGIATVIESHYDAPTAQYWIYQSLGFRLLWLVLGLNIACVMQSRMPWKKRHLPFLVAHLGILILLVGAWVTDKFGIQGRLTLREGETSSVVELDQPLLFAHWDQAYRSVGLRWQPPGVVFKPLDLRAFGLPAGWKIVHFLSHAEPQLVFIPSEKALDARARMTHWAAIRLRLSSEQMPMTQDYWLWEGAQSWQQVQAGPAQLGLGLKDSVSLTPPYLLLIPKKTGGLSYHAFGSEGLFQKGELLYPSGKWIRPHWKAGVRFQVLEWLPQAWYQRDYVPASQQFGSDAPPSALQIEVSEEWSYLGQKQFWLGIGDEIFLESQHHQSARLGYYFKRLILPFQLRLEQFKIDYEPGTDQPADYSSQLTVLDQRSSSAQPQNLWLRMNQPFTWRGFTFYQVSYQLEDQQKVSVFSVNQDPGRWLKYGGSFLIVVGCLWLFLRKRLGTFWMKFRLLQPQTIMAFVLLGWSGWVAAEPASHPDWDFKWFRSIPIQRNGRIQPIESFARQAILDITGQWSYQNWDPVDLVLSWMAFPEAWEKEPIIPLTRSLAHQLHFSSAHPSDRYSLAMLFEQPHFLNLLQGQASLSKTKNPVLEKVFQRVEGFHAVVSGQAWAVLPRAGAWQSLAQAESQDQPWIQCFTEILTSYQKKDFFLFNQFSEDWYQRVHKQLGSQKQDFDLKLEVFYQQARLFHWSWISYLIVCVVGLVLSKRQRVYSSVGFGFWALGWGLQVLGMAIRCYLAARPPVTNMYESVLWVSLGMASLGGFIHLLRKDHAVLKVASLLAGIGLALADSAPELLDPAIRPLVPVLRSSFWLMIHVLVISFSYAAFGLAFGLGNLSLYHYGKAFVSRQSAALQTVSQRTELQQWIKRATQIGVVCIAAGTILGGIWADYAWGRFWGWDPKEVWALITLLSYLIVLHARAMGWIGPFGFSVAVVLCFLSVLMAWYGVNFLLGTGLHSYGFSQGGFWGVGLGVGFELIYLLVILGLRVRYLVHRSG